MNARTVGALLACVMASGCYTHEINTAERWCEHREGVDLKKEYGPIWAPVFATRIDAEAIRDDFAGQLNQAAMSNVEGRADRMVWREGAVLYAINPSSLFVVDPDEFIDYWRAGIAADLALKPMDAMGRCIFGTLTSMFDEFHINSPTPDALGLDWEDSIIVLSTERERRLGSERL